MRSTTKILSPNSNSVSNYNLTSFELMHKFVMSFNVFAIKGCESVNWCLLTMTKATFFGFLQK